MQPRHEASGKERGDKKSEPQEKRSTQNVFVKNRRPRPTREHKARANSEKPVTNSQPRAQDASIPKPAIPETFDLQSLRGFYAAGGQVAAIIRAVYARIAELDDPGIFITLRPEADVLADAASLPQNMDLEAQPLWGAPFAAKDNIDVAGLPTTAACPGFAYTPDRSAFVIDRLLEAGALLIGKTNLDQFATGLVGTRSPYPIPKNAIDPTLAPGGSSSGSAVAVAQGLVTFALGTDTAGSGRVPAGLNNIVGLKPSVGAVSTRGVVPACRTLDCVSVFALTIDDAALAAAEMAVFDAEDPYSKPIAIGLPAHPAKKPRIGIPRPEDLFFFDDAMQAEAWTQSLTQLKSLAADLVPIDLTPFFQTAALLYEGPWIAERHVAMAQILAREPDIVHPVTRRIVSAASGFSASDLFAAQYRLATLKRQIEPVWQTIDMLAVPTTPIAPSLAALAADPITPNSRCGTYTNFVNLLELCALAVPGPFRLDERAAGLTLIAPSGQDADLAGFGRLVHRASAVPLGATGAKLPVRDITHLDPDAQDRIELAVVGAHLSGMALNHELTMRGGVMLRLSPTSPDYRLYALPGNGARRPGLLRVSDGTGARIATEIWSLPARDFAHFVRDIPAPLGIGTIRLADGTRPKGFLVEAEGVRGADDISQFGGWRAYIAAGG